MATLIRVELAEDYHLVREGIRKLLEAAGEFQIVGEANDGQEAIELVKKLKPEVLVMDLKMPRLNGLEAALQLKKLNVDTQVIILSMYADEMIVQQALRNGIRSYVLKQSVGAELLAAIQTAYRGGLYLSSGVSQYNDTFTVSQQSKSLLENHSPREQEDIKMVIAGQSTQEIADSFYTSVKTVYKQRRSAMDKLGVNDVANLVRVGLQLSLGTLDNI
jgi:DNA-binding NarL/FixJ family response regulator